MDLDISKIKKIFFIGIGGIGISALAKMALSRGIEVLGLNDEESPKTLDSLRDAGAIIFIPDAYSVGTPTSQLRTSGMNIHFELPDADMYVYSDAWIHRGPEIIADAKTRNKPVLSYFETLGIFAKEYKVIAIAGTHGKTTTTAIVAEIMIDAGLDPTVVCGSFAKKLAPSNGGVGSNFRKGNSEYLLVEADEYNRHFLNFHPFISVVTNIEADHLDYYKDLADVQNAFDTFLSQSEHAITDYQKYMEKVPKLLVPGEHNRLDAGAALGVADKLGINIEDAQKSLSQFAGTWRRLEKKGMTKEGTLVYDDYAHHPTEVKASLEALREIYPKGEKHITVIFQPHLYSRTKAFFKEFTECFNEADNVFLLPIYFAREDPDESVSSEKLADAIRLHRGEAVAFKDFTEAETWIRDMKLGEKDVLVTMGAGEAYKVADGAFELK